MKESFICISNENVVHSAQDEEVFRAWLWGKNYNNYTFFKVENGGLTQIIPLPNLSGDGFYIECSFDKA